ncbi:hypothetical protein [Cystobacter fuscus]|uniref:hypothetical protein n=1 Tax=Cystobacter fuscus TaxID=43 RepID=UPI0037BFB333
MMLLALGLSSGGNVSHATDSLAVPPDARNFIQPFFLVVDRNEDQVIGARSLAS